MVLAVEIHVLTVEVVVELITQLQVQEFLAKGTQVVQEQDLVYTQVAVVAAQEEQAPVVSVGHQDQEALEKLQASRAHLFIMQAEAVELIKDTTNLLAEVWVVEAIEAQEPQVLVAVEDLVMGHHIANIGQQHIFLPQAVVVVWL
jgi:hypothetical protein